MCVCVCVRLSVCKISKKTYERILVIFRGFGRGLRINRLDFGGDSNHDPDPGILKGFFTYFCDFCRQPRIKRENLRRRCAVYRVLCSLSHYIDLYFTNQW